MKTIVQLDAIEARISVNEEDGGFDLDLTLYLSDGTERKHEKHLENPSFRLELAGESEKDEHASERIPAN